jgi:Domain of unknown function (DUF4351)
MTEFRDDYDLKRYEEEKQMPYVTSIERMGIEQGRQEGQRSLILRLLTRKIGPLPEETIAQVSQLSIEHLDALAEELFDFNDLADLNRWLAIDRPSLHQGLSDRSPSTCCKKTSRWKRSLKSRDFRSNNSNCKSFIGAVGLHSVQP